MALRHGCQQVLIDFISFSTSSFDRESGRR